VSDRLQPPRRPNAKEERAGSLSSGRLGAVEVDDRLAENRVLEICDSILRKLAELQSGEPNLARRKTRGDYPG